MSTTVISYPIPAYSNPAIESQFYEPSRFIISAITLGITTSITTSVAHNYVVGQQVRLLIPSGYGCTQLNYSSGYVTSVPTSTSAVVDIDSSKANLFISTPFTATITAATKANPCVITASNHFVPGNIILISSVSGMTQLNGVYLTVVRSNSSTITTNINSTTFTTYTSGGTATLSPPNFSVPQIIAIGDVNSGAINASGPSNVSTQINGSFINIS